MADCHIVFFPFMASGHMIPMADMAVLFASHGLQTTIITTPSNTSYFSKSVHKTINYRHQIALHIIDFKPAGDTSGQTLSDLNIFKAILTLQELVEQFIQETNPNCLVADMFYPWTTEIAAKFHIPRIVFNGTGFFALCATEAVRLFDPVQTVSSGSEPFVVPHLPHEIKLTKRQLARFDSEFLNNLFAQIMKADVTSYGIIVNSFYELEPDYVHYYREVMKRKAWHIGPLSLCNKNITSIDDEHECLKWLETKPTNSVVYLSFGTLVKVTSSQVREIATGLESCDQDFIWVVKNDEQKSIPGGFEARMKEKGRGLVIKGWAPQVAILDHDSVGGFVTHCGWNSVLEGVLGGVAMVGWPVMAEQFYNMKLVTDVLRIGVSIDYVEWSESGSYEGVKSAEVEKAVTRIMRLGEGDEMRRRAQVLKEKARMSIDEGGSSFLNLNAFIKDIKAYKYEK